MVPALKRTAKKIVAMVSKQKIRYLRKYSTTLTLSVLSHTYLVTSPAGLCSQNQTGNVLPSALKKTHLKLFYAFCRVK